MTVYDAKTTMHGAGKCYKELKKSNINCDSFSIMNINDNTIYNFKLGQSRIQNIFLKGGTNELINNNQYSKQQDTRQIHKIQQKQTQLGGVAIMTLKTQIEKLTNTHKVLENRNKVLENRIKVLENKINE